MSSPFIISVKRRWRTIKTMEGILLGGGLGLLVLGISRLLRVESMMLSGFVVLFSILTYLIFSGVFKITDTQVARYLSKSYPQLQNSTELLVKETSSLNDVERIQRQTVEAVAAGITVQVPFLWRLPLLIACFGAVVYMLGFLFPFNITQPLTIVEEAVKPQQIITTSLNPDINVLTIKLAPPAYSGIKVSYQQMPSIDILEGSRITWAVTFNQPTDSARIVFSNGRKVEMKRGASFTVSSVGYFNDFYHFEIIHKGQVRTTELYPIRISKDQGPTIDMHQREPFQEFDYGTVSSTEILTTVDDDFGINSANIIATVAKGTGESIRFREEVIPFENSFRKGARSIKLNKIISLDSLKLEPGDELYFYVSVADNKLPTPNVSKSETYFVALIDTAEIEFSLAGTLGVDLMPEYFRSQRQLIIDTEKLIKSKPKLSRHDFNFQSNELGFDQKVLRLKYGQFMGEEFVSDAGGGVEDINNEPPATEEEQMSEYTHDHDAENEHNLLEINDAGEELGHSHDNAEENTYFSMSVRTKLKEAMTQMWDAELYLRLYQPRNSLPYQYKALELIKEIKNHARIYVQRMGFDPPPIKPMESRLKGKALDDVVSSRAKNSSDANDLFRETRILMEEINKHFISNEPIERNIWQKVGNELAPMAIKEPGKFFVELNRIQKFREGKTEAYDIELKELYLGLIQLMPEDNQGTANHYARSKWNKALSDQLKLED